MGKSGLRHLSLRTHDLERTVDFYTRLLGLEIAFRVPPDRVFLRWPRGDDLLDFVKSKVRPKGRQSLDHFGFSVPKSTLRTVEQRLKKENISIEGRRGRSGIYFQDPNGYLVEFYCD